MTFSLPSRLSLLKLPNNEFNTKNKISPWAKTRERHLKENSRHAGYKDTLDVHVVIGLVHNAQKDCGHHMTFTQFSYHVLFFQCFTK